MKATGIVRRIDELGRVVIPKEIRSTLRLKSGDPLEIFTERDELMLKKYSPIASLENFQKALQRASTTCPVILPSSATPTKCSMPRARASANCSAKACLPRWIKFWLAGAHTLPILRKGAT